VSGYRVTVHTDDGRKYHFQRGTAPGAKALARKVLAVGVSAQRQGVLSYYPPSSVRRVLVEEWKA
jgi:hypothetical protein